MKNLEKLSGAAVEMLLQCVYPPSCLSCNTSLFGMLPAVVCEDCWQKIGILGEGCCPFCGYGIGPDAAFNQHCSRCDPDAQDFTRATAVVKYGPVTSKIVHALKFYGDRRLAPVIAETVSARIIAAGFPAAFDAVVPVPLHHRRLRERGYDQAGLIASHLDIDSPVLHKALKRIRHTDAQAGLKYEERVTNPVGAFKTDFDFSGQTVLLIDDVLTTGTTVSECAAVLRKAGSTRVYVAVFAR